MLMYVFKAHVINFHNDSEKRKFAINIFKFQSIIAKFLEPMLINLNVIL